MTRILTDMFEEMATRRSEGAAAQQNLSPVEQTALVLYGTLRAHGFMRELMNKDFERHPCLTPTFNAFLFVERAGKADIRRLTSAIASVRADVKAIQSRVDKGQPGPAGPKRARRKKKNDQPDDVESDAE